MKTFKILMIVLIFSSNSFAQNGINYKALIKDDLGNVIANNTIQIKFKIFESDSHINVYEESHSPMSDPNGVIIVNIGEGTIISGVFEAINWGGDEHFLNVKINSGSGFIDLGTTQFSAVPYAFHALNAANVKGLKAFDEGNGIGWRLIGRQADNYDNIGFNAIDFSFVDDPNLGLGATGNYAFSVGYNGTASGEHALAFGNQNYALNDFAIALGNNNNVSGLNSTAIGGINQVSGDYAIALGLSNIASNDFSAVIGRECIASGINSIAFGYLNHATGNHAINLGNQNEASGENSIALGILTEASGRYSNALGHATTASGFVSTAMGHATHATHTSTTAMGYNTTASGPISVAMGNTTEASGSRSTAMGSFTMASSFSSTAIGRYNVGGGTAYAWVGSEPLFEIGNSFYGTPRSNALTVLKNGKIGIGTHTPQELLHISGGRLRIGTETIEDTGNNQLSFNASLLPDIDNAMNLGNSNARWNAVWSVDGSINTSDRRVKKNIKKLNYGLIEVIQMQPVSYNWKDKDNPDKKLGLIAQDLLKIVPEVVVTHEWKATSDDDNAPLEKVELDRLGVHYSDLIPVLINAIKEQQEIINNQNGELTEIKENYKSLLSRIEIIESKTIN